MNVTPGKKGNMKTSRSPHRIRIALLSIIGTFLGITAHVESAMADNRIEHFPTGRGPRGMAFDGANIWVACSLDYSVQKLRASDGVILDQISMGLDPYWTIFDGANIWVTVGGR